MADNTTVATCCKRQRLSNMDYVYHGMGDNGRFEATPKVHRVCVSCWTHWHGPADNVTRYSSKEWNDSLIRSDAIDFLRCRNYDLISTETLVNLVRIVNAVEWGKIVAASNEEKMRTPFWLQK